MSRKTPDKDARAHQAVAALPAEKAYAVGTAVGSLLLEGMPPDQASKATIDLADFIARGMAAQQAVDAIIAKASKEKTKK